MRVSLTRDLEMVDEDVNVLKVLLSVGLALIVVGVALIPLPGPGSVVLSGGVIVAAVAAVMLRKRPERT
jgi:hypothetical protein